MIFFLPKNKLSLYLVRKTKNLTYQECKGQLWINKSTTHSFRHYFQAITGIVGSFLGGILIYHQLSYPCIPDAST